MTRSVSPRPSRRPRRRHRDAQGPQGLTAAKKRELRGPSWTASRPSRLRPVEPPPGRLHRQEVPGVGPPAARPDPGGQPRLMHAVEKFDWRKASSSRPMPPGGSAKPSPAASPTPGAPSAPGARRRHAGRVQKAQARLELKLGPRPHSSSSVSKWRCRGQTGRSVALPGRALSLSEPLREDGTPSSAMSSKTARPSHPSRWPPSRCCPTRSAGCSRRSTSGAGDPPPPFRSRPGEPRTLEEVASTSTSPGSGSARSRPGPCPSCGTRLLTPALATC